MKRTFMAAMVLALAAAAYSYERLQGPTELLYYDKEKALSGYTLFGTGGRTFLIDMDGQVVHTWPIGTNPHLLDNGDVLDASRDDPSGFSGFVEVDWDGKTVWEYTEKRPGYFPHHDWERIINRKTGEATTIYIANKAISNEEALAAGADPAKAPYNDGQMDVIVEVDMKGNVIWEWSFFDHLIQDKAPTKANYAGTGKTVASYPGRLNLNMPGKPLRADWLHCNSLDYNADTGHIVINSVQGELYVIDHDGTFIPGDPAASIATAAGESGDFLYRFGDPARYGQGDAPKVLENWNNASAGNTQMGGTHDAQWIKSGLPGAGHLMVFNNGQYLLQRTPSSSIIEIDPYLAAGGKDSPAYVNPPDAGYRRVSYDKDTHNDPRLISNQVVWSWQPLNNHGMFSHIGSSAQRLANGGLFVCSDTEGHFFELDAKGTLVWEYINPVTKDGAVKVLGDALPMTNSVFRAYRYTAEDPALKGRTLVPSGTITDRAAQGLDAQSPKKNPPPGDRPAGGAAPGGAAAGGAGGKKK